MASNKTVNQSFNYGNTVQIKKNAPDCYKPGLLGSVRGMHIIDSEELALKFNQDIDSELYLVEFEDGEAIEIPTCFLIFFE